MKSLDEIHEHVKESTMVLVINNNKKLLLDPLCNFIYNKYKGKKSKIRTGKGLHNKLLKIKDKFVIIDIDYNRIQLGSNKGRLQSELNDIKLNLHDNNSMVMFKCDLRNKFIYESWEKWKINSYYYVFDLIIMIDVDNIKILKTPIYSRGLRNNEELDTFDIIKLIRRTKLKNLF